MIKYRIKATEISPTETQYIVQERAFGFLWWFEICQTYGFPYNSYEHAFAAFQKHRYAFYSTVTYTDLEVD